MVCKVQYTPPATLQARLRPSNLHLRPFQVTPTALKSPCRERAYDPQTSTYDPLPGHTYDSDIRTWKEEKRESRRVGKIAQRWKDEKTQTQVNRVFRLTMHSACKMHANNYAVESKRRQANCTMTEVRTRLCLNLRQKKMFLQAAAEKGIEFSAMHRTCHS